MKSNIPLAKRRISSVKEAIDDLLIQKKSDSIDKDYSSAVAKVFSLKSCIDQKFLLDLVKQELLMEMERLVNSKKISYGELDEIQSSIENTFGPIRAVYSDTMDEVEADMDFSELSTAGMLCGA